jgi:class 3 adenylate cyclase
MSETRKLVAILAADVVGYSRLAGADEDRILALACHQSAVSSSALGSISAMSSRRATAT